MQASVTELWVYPIKSCAGIRVATMRLGRAGPVDDRRWVVVSADTGKFLSLRDTPKMALITPALVDEGVSVRLRGSDQPPLLARNGHQSGERRPLNVWGSDCWGWDAGDEAARWFTEALGKSSRLLSFDDDTGRTIDDAAAPNTELSGFADAFPLLLLSDASVTQLNDRLREPVDARRFRANVLLGDCPPHAEDSWRRVRIGDIAMTLVKPCARCKAVKVDPDTAAVGRQPLSALRSYRRTDDGVMFGVNALNSTVGVLREGDPVQLC